MSFPTVTASVAAIFAIVTVLLSFQTSLRRRVLKVSHGDAGDEILRRRIRAHGNFIEYAPLAVIVLLMVELSGAANIDLWILAIGMVAARVLHAAGMLYATGPALRAAAMLLQHAAFLYGAVVLIRMVLNAG